MLVHQHYAHQVGGAGTGPHLSPHSLVQARVLAPCTLEPWDGCAFRVHFIPPLCLFPGWRVLVCKNTTINSTHPLHPTHPSAGHLVAARASLSQLHSSLACGLQWRLPAKLSLPCDSRSCSTLACNRKRNCSCMYTLSTLSPFFTSWAVWQWTRHAPATTCTPHLQTGWGVQPPQPRSNWCAAHLPQWSSCSLCPCSAPH